MTRQVNTVNHLNNVKCFNFFSPAVVLRWRRSSSLDDHADSLLMLVFYCCFERCYCLTYCFDSIRRLITALVLYFDTNFTTKFIIPDKSIIDAALCDKMLTSVKNLTSRSLYFEIMYVNHGGLAPKAPHLSSSYEL